MTGKLLGNGVIQKGGDGSAHFSFRHTSFDLEWTMYCYEQLKHEGLLLKPTFEKNTHIAQSMAHSTIDTLYDIWYEDGKKIIPLQFIENYLTEESLAWWYQDRGHLKKKENGTLEKLILSTEQWTDEERELLQYVLNLKFGLLFAIDGQKRLLLNDQLQINYFLTLVQPWMQPCMVRKMKTITVRKPIVKRTTVRLTSHIKLNAPTSEINKSIQDYGPSIQLNGNNFKRWNYQRFEQNDTTLYQIELTLENRQLLNKIQANTGLSMNQIVQECFHQHTCHSHRSLQTLDDLTITQQNIVLGSILGDGMLTHYPTKQKGIRSSYYEHFSIEQQSYRSWKVMKLEPYFTFQQKGTVITSKIDSLWSTLEPLFYKYSHDEGSRIKRIPNSLLYRLNDLHGLVTLYLDDGSLMISHRVNHRLNKIYLTPHLAFNLQNFTYKELKTLVDQIKQLTSITFILTKCPDGNGYYLRTTKATDTLQFLKQIHPITETCPTMSYKTNWTYRLHIEKQKWNKKYPDYQVLTSSRERMRPYTTEEIETILAMKRLKQTDQKIADRLGRTYWAIVYKVSELRKEGKL
jgi:hypothetical protein